MAIVNELFEKNIENLEHEDILNYFKTAKDESDLIEYKSFFIRGQNNFKIKEKAVLKTICAFLNSNGGFLIWGAPIEVKDELGNTKYSGDLSPIDRIIEKDSFVSKLINSITPIPNGIKFKSIILKDKQESIVAVEVPESNYQPHRFEGRYWMRLDGQSIVAPHHYVEALFKQVKYPNIEGYIKFESISPFQNRDTKGFKPLYNYIVFKFRTIVFNFTELINEENLTSRIICSNGKFYKYMTNPYIEYFSMGGHEFRNPNAAEILYHGEPILDDHELLIDPEELIKGNTQVKISFIFGGRKSPQKRSIYTLDLKEYMAKNVNDLIINLEENVSNSDWIERTGKSKKELLKKMLGR